MHYKTARAQLQTQIEKARLSLTPDPKTLNDLEIDLKVLECEHLREKAR